MDAEALVASAREDPRASRISAHAPLHPVNQSCSIAEAATTTDAEGPSPAREHALPDFPVNKDIAEAPQRPARAVTARHSQELREKGCIRSVDAGEMSVM